MHLVNKEQFDQWAYERMLKNHDIVSTKADICGDHRNVAWQDVVTKEIFSLEWECDENDPE
jgi:hypothetical protein